MGQPSSHHQPDERLYLVIKALTLTAAGVDVAGLLSASAASAEAPGCTAGALSAALGQTAADTGNWLNAHPAANDMLTNVGNTGNRDDVRVYFVNHQSEWAELQAIAAPLRNLRAQCGGDGAEKASGIGDLFNAMSQ